MNKKPKILIFGGLVLVLALSLGLGLGLGLKNGGSNPTPLPSTPTKPYQMMVNQDIAVPGKTAKTLDFSYLNYNDKMIPHSVPLHASPSSGSLFVIKDMIDITDSKVKDDTVIYIANNHKVTKSTLEKKGAKSSDTSTYAKEIIFIWLSSGQASGTISNYTSVGGTWISSITNVWT